MKYYSSVLAVFKNESSFLPEWIDHYLNRGIEHIYLLNDDSNDDFYDKIFRYIENKSVTLKNVDSCDQDKNREWRQVYLYNKYYEEVISETFWIGIMDLDEFFYSPNTNNLNNIFKDFEKTPYQELLADWYWFGSNNQLKQPKEIVSSFIKRSRSSARELNFKGYHHEWCCKSFGKTKLIKKLKHHFNEYYYLNKEDFCTMGKKGNELFSFNLSSAEIAFINHYIGSQEYYLSKKTRGSCNNSNIIRDEKMYKLLNKNQVIDTRLRDQYYDNK